MIKVILFDLGNVLAKTFDNNKLYEFLNTNLSYEEFEKYWFGSKPVIDAHMGLVSDTYQVEKLIEYCNSSITVDDFFKFFSSVDISLYDDVVNLIQDLKIKYKVGLLSNLRLMDYNRYKEELDRINFDYLFLSYEMNCIKPNNDIYEKVIKVCNCRPDEILFFDDNIRNVNSARECGINAFQVTGGDIEKINNIINNCTL